MLSYTDMTVRRIWMEISEPRLPLAQAEDSVSSLFTTIVCSPRSHHHSAQGFLFASWLEGLIDAQRALTEYIFLYLPSSFWFLRNAQSTEHVFASPNFWAIHPFHTGAWAGVRTGHLVIPVTQSESKTRTLLWKGKQMCYVIVPSCPSWILQRIVFKGLESKPAAIVETQGIHLKFSIATLSSFPSMLWLSNPLGWHCVHKHWFLSGSCCQCENLLSSALCLCQLGNGGKILIFPLYSKWPHDPTHGQVCHESKNVGTVRTT